MNPTVCKCCDKCCRCREVKPWFSRSFLGPTVLHLLPWFPAGPGTGQVQGALPPPQQPACSESCRPPDTGLRPCRQPCPPGPHHHIQWQRQGQDPQETGGTVRGALMEYFLWHFIDQTLQAVSQCLCRFRQGWTCGWLAILCILLHTVFHISCCFAL